MTAYAEGSGHAENFSVSAREVGDQVVFLHRLAPGPASRSYGLAVARLAGLPESVLARAKAVLASLESGAMATGGTPKGRRETPQLGLFDPPAESSSDDREVLATLRAVDVQRLTPLDALNLVARLKQRLD